MDNISDIFWFKAVIQKDDPFPEDPEPGWVVVRQDSFGVDQPFVYADHQWHQCCVGSELDTATNETIVHMLPKECAKCGSVVFNGNYCSHCGTSYICKYDSTGY